MITCSTHLRNVFLLYHSYQLAYDCEYKIYQQVLSITQQLKSSDSMNTNGNSGTSGNNMSKQEKAQLQNDLMQQKLSLINELQGLIPIYSDAVLAYMKAFQSIAICIEAVSDTILYDMMLYDVM